MSSRWRSSPPPSGEAEFLRLPFGDRFAPDGTRSGLEARMLSLCRRHRLPKPEVNVKVDRYTVDFLWQERRLIVEVDGWEGHRSRTAFETDRARDAPLKILGYDVLRFTWRQVTKASGEVPSDDQGAVGRRSAAA